MTRPIHTRSEDLSRLSTRAMAELALKVMWCPTTGWAGPRKNSGLRLLRPGFYGGADSLHLRDAILHMKFVLDLAPPGTNPFLWCMFYALNTVERAKVGCPASEVLNPLILCLQAASRIHDPGELRDKMDEAHSRYLGDQILLTAMAEERGDSVLRRREVKYAPIDVNDVLKLKF